MSVRKDHRYLHIKKSGGHLGNQLPFLIWKRPGEGKQCARGHMGSGCNLASLLQAWWFFSTSPSFLVYLQWEMAPCSLSASGFWLLCSSSPLSVPSHHLLIDGPPSMEKRPTWLQKSTCHQAEDIPGALAMSACSLLQYVLALWGEKTIIRKQLETRTGCLVCAKLCCELFEGKDFP